MRVAGVVIREGRLLVQRPLEDPDACFAFIGGEYQIGDTLESRLRSEFEEETTARVIRAEYRFAVENHFVASGAPG
ncbi:MAG: NUDIX domain-containing protein [Deltaproteobacteria bacterium]